MSIIVTQDTYNVRRQLRREGYQVEQSALMAAYLTGRTTSLRPTLPPPVLLVQPATPGEVRAWAQAQGMVVRPKGRVPESIVAAYQAAH